MVHKVKASPALVWYRQTDLRVHDHKPLTQAHKGHESVLHVFCYDPRIFDATVDCSESLYPTSWPKTGPIRRRFIDESVAELRATLCQESGEKNTLLIRYGKPEDVIPNLVQRYNVSDVYCHQAEADEEQRVQDALQTSLASSHPACADAPTSPGVHLHAIWGGTLYEPDALPFDIHNKFPNTASNFRAQTRGKVVIPEPLPTPASWRPLPSAARDVELGQGDHGGGSANNGSSSSSSSSSGSGSALPRDGALTDTMASFYRGGEHAALQRVQDWIWGQGSLPRYKETRNEMLGTEYSSKWSPWLAAGCVSVRYIHQQVRKWEQMHGVSEGSTHMIFELEVREYFRFYCLAMGNSVFHRGGPKLRQQKLRAQRDQHSGGGKQAKGGQKKGDQQQQQQQQRPLQWRQDIAVVKKWCCGETGNPMIDANMRELLTTGYMSNRGRQIVASYLTRDMGQDWRFGALWFETMLIDHDVCQNWGNWTYAAGVGSDPREDRYFSIPRQTERYDPNHDYIRHWLAQPMPPMPCFAGAAVACEDSVWGQRGSRVPSNPVDLKRLLTHGTRPGRGPSSGKGRGRGGGKGKGKRKGAQRQ